MTKHNEDKIMTDIDKTYKLVADIENWSPEDPDGMTIAIQQYLDEVRKGCVLKTDVVKKINERIEIAQEIIGRDKEELKKCSTDHDLKIEIIVNENIVGELLILKAKLEA